MQKLYNKPSAQELSLECKELTNWHEFESAFTVMQELHPDIVLENYQSFIEETVPESNLLFGLFANDQLLSVASTHKIRLINDVRLLWIFHMVTKEGYRSLGYGRRLMQFIENYAREHGFQQLRVHSTNRRKRAHKFYREIIGIPDFAIIFGKEL